MTLPDTREDILSLAVPAGIKAAAKAICLVQGYDAVELDTIGSYSGLPLWKDKKGAAEAAISAYLAAAPTPPAAEARGPLLAKAEAQVAYWQQRQLAEKSLEDGTNADGEDTPIGDQAAWSAGYCNGRYSEADWWLKTLTEAAEANLDDAVHDAQAAEAELRLVRKGLAASEVRGFNHGIAAAAKFVMTRMLDYVSEHGSTDPETGTVEFPGDGDEYVGELEEIEEGIRSLASPAPKGET